LDETTEANAEPVLVSVKRQRRSGQVFGDLELAAPVTAACSVKLSCYHHWIIEVATDPLSKGVCRLCGEEKLFRNQFQWAEIAPPRVVNSRRHANDSMNIPEQRGEYAPQLAQGGYGGSMALQSAGRGY
jgi:hypothetical protein